MRVRTCLYMLAAIAAATPCAAGAATPHLDVSFGRSITADHRWTDVAFLDLTAATHEDHGLQWQPDFTLGWVDGRHTRLYDLKRTVWVGAAGVRLVNWWRKAFFSFQVGGVSGRTDALNDTPQFVSSLGWQGRHWQLMLRHISNGKLSGGRNLGETMLLAGVRF